MNLLNRIKAAYQAFISDTIIKGTGRIGIIDTIYTLDKYNYGYNVRTTVLETFVFVDDTGTQFSAIRILNISGIPDNTFIRMDVEKMIPKIIESSRVKWLTNKENESN